MGDIWRGDRSTVCKTDKQENKGCLKWKKEKQGDTKKEEDKKKTEVVSYRLKREWSKSVWPREIERRRRRKQTQKSTTSWSEFARKRKRKARLNAVVLFYNINTGSALTAYKPMSISLPGNSCKKYSWRNLILVHIQLCVNAEYTNRIFLHHTWWNGLKRMPNTPHLTWKYTLNAS